MMGVSDLPANAATAEPPVLPLPVSRWGNSLAVRIPAKVARELGVSEGDTLSAQVLGPASLRLTGKPRAKRTMAEFLASIDAVHQRIPETPSSLEALRRGARY
jgi:antitoxin MazE